MNIILAFTIAFAFMPSAFADSNNSCVTEALAIGEEKCEQAFEGNERFDSRGPTVSARPIRNGYAVNYSRGSYDYHRHGDGEIKFTCSMVILFDIVCGSPRVGGFVKEQL